MKTYFDCVPCLIRQTVHALRLVTPDERIHEQVLRDLLLAGSRMDFRQPPVVMAQRVHRRIRELCRDGDPYRKYKERFNRLALELLAAFRPAVERAADPWEAAVRWAIAGNVIDVAVKSGLSEEQVRAGVAECLTEPLTGPVAEFVAAVAAAQRILYLADNAGEIVFDRLLIERLPRERVTVAVRGAPVINDATRSDAEVAGLTALVTVIDNGSDAPGTLLEDCSPEFRQRFAESDLIISKGQGNYETLREAPQRIYFLLRVKCPIIARDVGCPVGRMVLQPSPTAKEFFSRGAAHGPRAL